MRFIHVKSHSAEYISNLIKDFYYAIHVKTYKRSTCIKPHTTKFHTKLISIASYISYIKKSKL